MLQLSLNSKISAQERHKNQNTADPTQAGGEGEKKNQYLEVKCGQ